MKRKKVYIKHFILMEIIVVEKISEHINDNGEKVFLGVHNGHHGLFYESLKILEDTKEFYSWLQKRVEKQNLEH